MKRFDQIGGALNPNPIGPLMFVEDHDAELAALRAENEGRKDWNVRVTDFCRTLRASLGKPAPEAHAIDCLLVIDHELAALRAENERLKADLFRVQQDHASSDDALDMQLAENKKLRSRVRLLQGLLAVRYAIVAFQPAPDEGTCGLCKGIGEVVDPYPDKRVVPCPRCSDGKATARSSGTIPLASGGDAGIHQEGRP